MPLLHLWGILPCWSLSSAVVVRAQEGGSFQIQFNLNHLDSMPYIFSSWEATRVVAMAYIVFEDIRTTLTNKLNGYFSYLLLRYLLRVYGSCGEHCQSKWHNVRCVCVYTWKNVLHINSGKYKIVWFLEAFLVVLFVSPPPLLLQLESPSHFLPSPKLAYWFCQSKRLNNIVFRSV